MIKCYWGCRCQPFGINRVNHVDRIVHPSIIATWFNALHFACSSLCFPILFHTYFNFMQIPPTAFFLSIYFYFFLECKKAFTHWITHSIDAMCRVITFPYNFIPEPWPIDPPTWFDPFLPPPPPYFLTLRDILSIFLIHHIIGSSMLFSHKQIIRIPQNPKSIRWKIFNTEQN